MSFPWKRLVGAGAVVGFTVLIGMGCSGDDPDTSGGGATGDGVELAAQLGCAGCHGGDGDGGVGPSWQGLIGSTVELEDGRELVADAAYVRRSIVDPGADVVDGYDVTMPEQDLSDDQVDALVRYIEQLG